MMYIRMLLLYERMTYNEDTFNASSDNYSDRFNNYRLTTEERKLILI